MPLNQETFRCEGTKRTVAIGLFEKGFEFRSFVATFLFPEASRGSGTINRIELRSTLNAVTLMERSLLLGRQKMREGLPQICQLG